MVDTQLSGTGYLMQTQTVTPSEGGTVVIASDDKDRTLNLTPAANLTAITVTFPADSTTRIGQVIRIASTKAITTINLTGGVTVDGFVSSYSANDVFSYQKTAPNTWKRLQ